ncbi:MAG TPA: hypothetical protein IGS40_24080 [Trichormus sp. M33_DOE_039]|nr:hypothetical protein [Trichormus sp. M33_DOE_039]
MTAVATSRETRRHLLQVGKPDDTCCKSGIARPTQCLPNVVSPQYPMPNDY